MKICTICTKEFEKGHGKKCNPCAWKQKVEKKKEFVTNLSEDPREFALNNGKYPEKCNRCEKIFDKNQFKFDTQLLRYRNPCKECYNKAKYYEVYRDKQKQNNYQEYTDHTRETHKKWIEENKVYMKEYHTEYNQTPERKINNILCVAKKNGNIDLDNILEIKERIIELVYNPCFYCGFHDTAAIIGIDRLNPNIHYTKDNMVSCCINCNFLKIL